MVTADYGAESALIAYVNNAAKEYWEASTGAVSSRPAYIFTRSVHNVRVERFWGDLNPRVVVPMIVRAAAGTRRQHASRAQHMCCRAPRCALPTRALTRACLSCRAFWMW